MASSGDRRPSSREVCFVSSRCSTGLPDADRRGRQLLECGRRGRCPRHTACVHKCNIPTPPRFEGRAAAVQRQEQFAAGRPAHAMDLQADLRSGGNTVKLDDEGAIWITLRPCTSQPRATWRCHPHRGCRLRRAVDRNTPWRTPLECFVAGVAALDHAWRLAVEGSAGPQAGACIKQAGEPPRALSRALWGEMPRTGAAAA
jgi:hypothetical protein